MPTSVQEMVALRVRRAELSDQLRSANSRRISLAEQLKAADPLARPGLEQRIGVLDERIVQIESDIAETGRQLTSAPAGVLAATEQSSVFHGLDSNDVGRLGAVFTIFVLFPLALAFTRLMWKRATAPRVATVATESNPRLERIEQAVEAIAIEVERISEGQRFVTRLLSEASPLPTLAAGKRAQEPARTPDL